MQASVRCKGLGGVKVYEQPHTPSTASSAPTLAFIMPQLAEAEKEDKGKEPAKRAKVESDPKKEKVRVMALIGINATLAIGMFMSPYFSPPPPNKRMLTDTVP